MTADCHADTRTREQLSGRRSPVRNTEGRGAHQEGRCLGCTFGAVLLDWDP